MVLTAPVWLPLAFLIAVWIKLVSSGPVLFRQERIGHLGARFYCLKFRTMKVNADTTVHREHLQASDDLQPPDEETGRLG